MVYFIGGGAIQTEGEKSREDADAYPRHLMKDIEAYREAHSMMPWEYMNHFDPLDGYMDTILQQMMATVNGGLAREGAFPGDLKLRQIAKELKQKADTAKGTAEREKLSLCAYAYSASEGNASRGMAIIAPTLGSSGILPALVCYHYRILGVSREQLRNGLRVAGLFGNLIKENAIVSDVQGGCQAEIGAVVAMGAAMVSYLHGQTMRRIEYAAEVGIEHHLGLTCDLVGSYVMIPCTERNAVGVLRTMDTAVLTEGASDLREYKVSFDMVVNTMNYTGKKISTELRETLLGGLTRVMSLK